MLPLSVGVSLCLSHAEIRPKAVGKQNRMTHNVRSLMSVRFFRADMYPNKLHGDDLVGIAKDRFPKTLQYFRARKGLHSRSQMKQWLADVRLMPIPAAVRLASMTCDNVPKHAVRTTTTVLVIVTKLILDWCQVSSESKL